jgi:hypothetical protein
MVSSVLISCSRKCNSKDNYFKERSHLTTSSRELNIPWTICLTAICTHVLLWSIWFYGESTYKRNTEPIFPVTQVFPVWYSIPGIDSCSLGLLNGVKCLPYCSTLVIWELPDIEVLPADYVSLWNVQPVSARYQVTSLNIQPDIQACRTVTFAWTLRVVAGIHACQNNDVYQLLVLKFRFKIKCFHRLECTQYEDIILFLRQSQSNSKCIRKCIYVLVHGKQYRPMYSNPMELSLSWEAASRSAS